MFNFLYKKIDSIGLAIFRIAFFTVLFFEICDLEKFKDIIYGPYGTIVISDIDLSIPLCLWKISCLMIILGLFTRASLLVNYVLSLVFISTINTFEYHMFYVYLGIGFLCFFIPISNRLSLDNLFLKIKYVNTKIQFEINHKVSVWNYWMIILHGIAFIYFGSIFFKFSSKMWMSGLGMWLPASMPMASITDNLWLLNNEVLIKGLGYLTVAFELIFIFLFWFKKFRVPLFLIGFGLHLGIVICFPLPWFGLGEIAILLLLVPNSIWNNLSKLFKSKRNLTVLYDKNCPLCIRTKVIFEHFDIFNAIVWRPLQEYASKIEELKSLDENTLLRNIYSINSNKKVFHGFETYIQIFKSSVLFFPLFIIFSFPGIKSLGNYVYKIISKNRLRQGCNAENCEIALVQNNLINSDDVKIFHGLSLLKLKEVGLTLIFIYFFTIQLGTIYNSGPVKNLRTKVGFYNSIADNFLIKTVFKYPKYYKKLFGVCPHAVFMDNHFKNYNHIISVVYVDDKSDEHFLPLIDQNGNPDDYLYGFNWVKWTFRVNSPNVTKSRLSNGIKAFTKYWIDNNPENLPLQKSRPIKFKVLVKKIDSPDGWSYDFKKTMQNRPWLDGGTVVWNKKKFIANIKEIEKI